MGGQDTILWDAVYLLKQRHVHATVSPVEKKKI